MNEDVSMDRPAWIRTADRLPPPGERVNFVVRYVDLLIPSYGYLGQHGSCPPVWVDLGRGTTISAEIDAVTHWMAVPELPEADDRALLREALALLDRIRWGRDPIDAWRGGQDHRSCPVCRCHGWGAEHHADAGCPLALLMARIAAHLDRPEKATERALP